MRIITEELLVKISLALSRFTTSPRITKREYKAMLGYEVSTSERDSYEYWLEVNPEIAFKLMVFRHYLHKENVIIYKDSNTNEFLLENKLNNKEIVKLVWKY